MNKIYQIIFFLLIQYTAFTQTISSNAPLCGNQNLTLELMATGGTTYAWTGPNGFTSTLQKPTIKNVNWKNRGIYTVTIDGKTTLTTDVNIKDPVAFTVPKEISVCEGGTLIIEPKSGRLTDSTEVADYYSFKNPSGNFIGDGIINNFLPENAGIYQVIGQANYYGCSISKNVTIKLNTSQNCKGIQIEDLTKVKMCYEQEVSIPFTTSGKFSEGTKFKVYIFRLNSLANSFDDPIAIVEKSPVVIKNIDKYFDQTIAIMIVADDAEKTTAISNYKYFYNHSFSMNSVQSCDSASLSVNYNFYIDNLQWYFNGNPINGANNNRITAKTTGTYSFKYTGTGTFNEIDKTCLYESQPVKIELGKIEKPSVSASNDIELCVGKPATLSISSKANTTYRWKKDGNYIANATNTTYETLQEGKYQIEAKEGTCTAISDTVVLKKPEKLPEIYFSIGSNTPIQGNQDVFTLCNNQEFYFVSDRVVFAKHQLFKNLQLIKETPDRTDFNFSPIKGEGVYYLKAVYGSCESVSRPITVKYSNTIGAKTYLRNNNLDLCEGNSAFFKLAFNGGSNYKLGDGLVYKDGKAIRNWFKYEDNKTSYYLDLEENKESGNYYAVGKATFPDKSECLIKTDTVKVKFSKKVFQNILDISSYSQTNLFTINTCKDSTEIQAYNNIGAYGRQISYKWIKDGIILKQDSSSILKANQAGTYQLETTYKDGCTIVSVPYKVEFGKIKVDLYPFEKSTICNGEFYQLYPNLSEFSDKNVYSIFKDEKLFKENALLIPSAVFYGYFDLSQSGTYKITVKNGKCEGTSPDFTLKVDKIPLSITPSDSITFCDGKTIELKTSTEAGLSYIWERNGSVISQANQANYTANTDGLYKATLLRGACWGTTPSVKLKPLANIIPTATLTGDKKIDYDQETKLSVNLTGYDPWTFKLSDGKEYTATKSPFEVSVKPLTTTTYSISEVKNICGTGTVSGSAKIEIIILSAEEEKELNVEVFPMPSSEICNWKVETPQATTALVVLYDALGVIQYTHTSTTRTQAHEGTIDLSTLKVGTYFLKLQMGEKSVTRKIIKL